MKFKVTEAVGELMDKLNEVIDEWQDLDYKPNSITQIEDTLERFYNDNNIDTYDVGRFDTSLVLSEEQINELADIADMAQNQDIYLEDFEKKFESAQGKADIETLEDYAKFVDNKTQFEDSIISSSKMSYYEYEDLMKHALKDKRRSEESVNKMIIDAYTKKGLEGSDLYDFVWNKTRKKR